MNVLLTGHAGYIGVVVARVVQDAAHQVTGLDTGFFADCGLPMPTPTIRTPQPQPRPPGRFQPAVPLGLVDYLPGVSR